MRNIFLLIFFVFLGCKTENLKNNNIIVDLNKYSNVSFYDIFLKQEMIPLETNSESLVREISKIEVFKDNLYIWDYTLSTIFVFNNQGNYLYKLSKKGHGPGEYLDISDFFIQKEREEIWILSAIEYCIHKYSLGMDYIGKIKLPKIDRCYKSMLQINQDTIAFWTFDYNKRMKYYSISQDNIFCEDFPEERKDIFCRYEFFVGKNLCRALTNQIYSVESGKTIPLYSWDFKQKNNKIEDLEIPKKQNEVIKYGQDVYASRIVNYVFNLHGANKKFKYAQLIIRNKYLNIFYDNDLKQSALFEKTKENIALYPIYWSDSYLISSSEVFSIEDLFLENLDDKKCFFNEHEDHNPVLIKSYFK